MKILDTSTTSTMKKIKRQEQYEHLTHICGYANLVTYIMSQRAIIKKSRLAEFSYEVLAKMDILFIMNLRGGHLFRTI